MKSIKTNFTFNLINTGSQFLFPILSFPYASRIMQADGIGVVSFYQSIISYVILISGLGIPLYGIKEISKVRSDSKLLCKRTKEILYLHLSLTSIAYLVIFLLVLFVPQINKNATLFLLLSISVIFTTIGCEWFYKGIEDFKYILIRGIIVKTLALLFLFLFINDRDDILWYGFFCVIGTLGGNIFNFYRLRSFLKVGNTKIKLSDILEHVKPIANIFIFSIITSLYLNLNPVLLGFFVNEQAVGYYTTGLKIFSITSSISGALATVMLPRVSFLLSEGHIDELNCLIQKAYNYSIGLTLPLCIWLLYVSPYVVRLLCGSGFDPSINCCRIMSPIVMFVSISGLMGTQILYPMGFIDKINIYCIVGAIIDICLNIILVPLLAQIGTSIAYATTEFVVMIISVIMAKNYISINFANIQIFNYLIGTLLLIVLFSLTTLFSFNNFIMTLFISICGIVSYSLFLYARKDGMIMDLLSMLK